MDAEVTFSCRMPESLRDAFAAACKAADTTPSREIRRLMREFIAKHGQTDLFGKPAPRKASRRA